MSTGPDNALALPAPLESIIESLTALQLRMAQLELRAGMLSSQRLVEAFRDANSQARRLSVLLISIRDHPEREHQCDVPCPRRMNEP